MYASEAASFSSTVFKSRNMPYTERACAKPPVTKEAGLNNWRAALEGGGVVNVGGGNLRQSHTVEETRKSLGSKTLAEN